MCRTLSWANTEAVRAAAFNDATERSRAVTVVLAVCIALPREPVAYQWSESSLYWFAGCCCSDWTTEGVCSVLWNVRTLSLLRGHEILWSQFSISWPRISILWPRSSISCARYSYIVATIKFFFFLPSCLGLRMILMVVGIFKSWAVLPPVDCDTWIELTLTWMRRGITPFSRDSIMIPNTHRSFARYSWRPTKTKTSWLSRTLLHSHLTTAPVHVFGAAWDSLRYIMLE